MTAYQPSEITVLAVALAAGIFMLGHREWLRQQHFSTTAIMWFVLQLLAWSFTVLEGFFYANLFNFLEHLFYAAAAVVALISCHCLFRHAKGGAQ